MHKKMSDEMDLSALPPTTEQSKAIKAIAKDTVHKICSGQVVLSLAVAVKELVENSLDAGASLIEVKLKDQGLESLEVSDNGSGVEEHNLEGLTTKYHTSKIRNFTDLLCVETFGFRGEALSSLCALADMSIVTRHRNSATAVRLDLDHQGQIEKRTPCARPVGTTVTLSNLFATLPVRKREFQRNIKKEFNKMCQILQAYGLVSKSVRIICTNQTAKGGKSVLMKTNGSNEVLDNIDAIFGSHQRADIIELKTPSLHDLNPTQENVRADSKAEDSEILQLSSEELDIAQKIKLEAYVSSCSHGAGRSSRDRQYFYINSRPCDPKNLIKLVNEVYHRYNSHQYPFIYLNIFMKRADVDVNLTPDKRQLLVNNEKLLLVVVKKALIDAFANIPSTFKMQNICSMMKESLQTKTEMTVNTEEEKENSNDKEEAVPKASAKRFQDVLSQWKMTGDTKGVAPEIKTTKRKTSDEVEVRTLKLRKIQEYLSKENDSAKSKVSSYESESDSDSEMKAGEALEKSVLDVRKMKAESEEFDVITKRRNAPDQNDSTVESIDCKVIPASQVNYKQLKIESISGSLSLTPLSQPIDSPSSRHDSCDDAEDAEDKASAISDGRTVLLDDSDSDECISNMASISNYEINTSIAEIELSLHAEENYTKRKLNQSKLERLRFKSEINPAQNSTAEQELQKEITKDMFATMDIIGQFNLGFIVVKLGSDLFIVDQHATDEKYNFEMLQRSVVMHHQPLAVPQALDMTAVNEMILQDHLEVFEKNGFRFAINENAPPTKKLHLLGKPFSKNWEFGKEDIDELIFMLQDAPEGTMCRPSRIRAMFASRACRKSVMIGKALNRATMKMLVRHMGEIDQPWNCPHGRPTMRHLINLAMLHEVVENSAN